MSKFFAAFYLLISFVSASVSAEPTIIDVSGHNGNQGPAGIKAQIKGAAGGNGGNGGPGADAGNITLEIGFVDDNIFVRGHSISSKGNIETIKKAIPRAQFDGIVLLAKGGSGGHGGRGGDGGIGKTGDRGRSGSGPTSSAESGKPGKIGGQGGPGGNGGKGGNGGNILVKLSQDADILAPLITIDSTYGAKGNAGPGGSGGPGGVGGSGGKGGCGFDVRVRRNTCGPDGATGPSGSTGPTGKAGISGMQGSSGINTFSYFDNSPVKSTFELSLKIDEAQDRDSDNIVETGETLSFRKVQLSNTGKKSLPTKEIKLFYYERLITSPIISSLAAGERRLIDLDEPFTFSIGRRSWERGFTARIDNIKFALQVDVPKVSTSEPLHLSPNTKPSDVSVEYPGTRGKLSFNIANYSSNDMGLSSDGKRAVSFNVTGSNGVKIIYNNQNNASINGQIDRLNADSEKTIEVEYEISDQVEPGSHYSFNVSLMYDGINGQKIKGQTLDYQGSRILGSHAEINFEQDISKLGIYCDFLGFWVRQRKITSISISKLAEDPRFKVLYDINSKSIDDAQGIYVDRSEFGDILPSLIKGNASNIDNDRVYRIVKDVIERRHAQLPFDHKYKIFSGSCRIGK